MGGASSSTLAPASTKASAMPSPIPIAPPVTSAIFPSRRNAVWLPIAFSSFRAQLLPSHPVEWIRSFRRSLALGAVGGPNPFSSKPPSRDRAMSSGSRGPPPHRTNGPTRDRRPPPVPRGPDQAHDAGERLESVLEANALLCHHPRGRRPAVGLCARPAFHPVCRRAVLYSEVPDVDRRRVMPP